jgi:4-carboxymuconolactone decarboxylase
MKVIDINQIPKLNVETDLFIGGQVSMQPLVTKEIGQDFNMTHVNFYPGARNKLHTHSSDQILLITDGFGIVSTETEESLVKTGDIIHIPAGEKHWHGATIDSHFSHISVTLLSSFSKFFE